MHGSGVHRWAHSGNARLQRRLADKGFIPVIADLLGVVSIEDISARICRIVFEVIQQREPLFKKAIRALTTFRPSLKPTAKGLGFSLSGEQAASDMGIEVLCCPLKKEEP